jgi:hypothetical protein
MTPHRPVGSNLAVIQLAGCLGLPRRLPPGARKPIDHVIAGPGQEALDLGYIVERQVRHAP